MIICVPQPTMSGRPATSLALRSSPTPRGTTSVFSRQTWTTVMRPPEVASCPTPSSSPRSWLGSEVPRPKRGRRDTLWPFPRSPFQPFRGPRHSTTQRAPWKAVVDADTDLILGAALLGHNAGEVISTLQMAMLGGLRYQQVRDAVPTHPTMGEGLNLLFDALDGQGRQG